MSPKVVLFLLATLLLISSSSVSARTSQVEKTNPGPSSNVSARMLQVKKTNSGTQFCNWLVQTWPIGYCYPRTNCKFNGLEFTIHGLWPVDSDGNGLDIPISCHMERDDICEMIQYHPQSAHFSTDMVTYWPCLISKNNVDFWSHEWNKHGRCQNSLVPTAYFINTIQVVKNINLKKILADERIVPSNSMPYPRERYITAIREKTQPGHPLLLCNPTRYTGIPVLGEVVICVNTIAKGFVPCPVQVTQPGYSLCLEEKIWFLEFLP